MKSELKKEAIALRRAGYSYSDIQKQIGVSKSTLSLWLSVIPYVPNEHAKEKLTRARFASALVKKQLKKQSFVYAHDLAEKDIGIFRDRDLFMLGLGIYIGEGSKTAHIVRVVNSDPAIIKIMIRWFHSFGITDRQFRLRLFLYPDSSLEKSETFWREATGLKKENILRPQIDRRKNKKKEFAGKLPYGTAHLSVIGAGKKEFGVLFFRRILSLIEIVLGS